MEDCFICLQIEAIGLSKVWSPIGRTLAKHIVCNICCSDSLSRNKTIGVRRVGSWSCCHGHWKSSWWDSSNAEMSGIIAFEVYQLPWEPCCWLLMCKFNTRFITLCHDFNKRVSYRLMSWDSPSLWWWQSWGSRIPLLHPIYEKNMTNSWCIIYISVGLTHTLNTHVHDVWLLKFAQWCFPCKHAAWIIDHMQAR